MPISNEQPLTSQNTSEFLNKPENDQVASLIELCAQATNLVKELGESFSVHQEFTLATRNEYISTLNLLISRLERFTQVAITESRKALVNFVLSNGKEGHTYSVYGHNYPMSTRAFEYSDTLKTNYHLRKILKTLGAAEEELKKEVAMVIDEPIGADIVAVGRAVGVLKKIVKVVSRDDENAWHLYEVPIRLEEVVKELEGKAFYQSPYEVRRDWKRKMQLNRFLNYFKPK